MPGVSTGGRVGQQHTAAQEWVSKECRVGLECRKQPGDTYPRSSSRGASNGSGGNSEREGRSQHRRPSAPRAATSGVQQAVVRSEPSDDRSEGELSGSDGGEDQRHPAAVVPGVAAVGPSPGQPGNDVGL
ncbi:hypothetical protein AB205_0170200, partial [Aquarana catesbeiana]